MLSTPLMIALPVAYLPLPGLRWEHERGKEGSGSWAQPLALGSIPSGRVEQLPWFCAETQKLVLAESSSITV